MDPNTTDQPHDAAPADDDVGSMPSTDLASKHLTVAQSMLEQLIKNTEALNKIDNTPRLR